MPHQLNVICRCPNKPDWGYWFTRFYIETPNPLSMENANTELRTLFELMRYIHKESISVDGIQWLDIGNPTSPKGAGIATYLRDAHNGLNVERGGLKYKHMLQCNYETIKGRHSRNWFRGCLDTSDIKLSENNGIALLTAPYFKDKFDSFVNGGENPLWQRLITKPAFLGSNSPVAGSHPLKIWNYKAVNAHALTRVRGGIDGSGKQIGATLLFACLGNQNLYEIAKGRIDNDGPFTPADIFEVLLGVLSGIVNTSRQIADYMKDADGKAETGEMPPISRFGFTGGSISSSWEEQAKKCAVAIETLPVAHHPVTVDASGDLYLKREDSQPYLDVIKEALDVLQWTCYFDGYNPKAFPEQEPRKGYEQLPEFVKMAL